VIFVVPAAARPRVRQSTVPSLTAGDVNAIEKDVPRSWPLPPSSALAGQLIYGNAQLEAETESWGSAPAICCRNWPMRQRGFFTERDITSAARCASSPHLVEKLFQTTNPLEDDPPESAFLFALSACLDKKGADCRNDRMTFVLLPLYTVQKRLQGSTFAECSHHGVAPPSRAMREAQNEITQPCWSVNRIKPGQNADFSVQIPTKLPLSENIHRHHDAYAGVHRRISLLVGGVGFMNVMRFP